MRPQELAALRARVKSGGRIHDLDVENLLEHIKALEEAGHAMGDAIRGAGQVFMDGVQYAAAPPGSERAKKLSGARHAWDRLFLDDIG